jgi:hypothetical protein
METGPARDVYRAADLPGRVHIRGWDRVNPASPSAIQGWAGLLGGLLLCFRHVPENTGETAVFQFLCRVLEQPLQRSVNMLFSQLGAAGPPRGATRIDWCRVRFAGRGSRPSTACSDSRWQLPPIRAASSPAGRGACGCRELTTGQVDQTLGRIVWCPLSGVHPLPSDVPAAGLRARRMMRRPAGQPPARSLDRRNQSM